MQTQLQAGAASFRHWFQEARRSLAFLFLHVFLHLCRDNKVCQFGKWHNSRGMPVRSRRTQHWSLSPKHLHHVFQSRRQVPFLAVGNSGGMPEPATYFCALLYTIASGKNLEPDAFTFLISWNKQTPEWVLCWGPGRGLTCAEWVTGICDFAWIIFADTEIRLLYQTVVLLNANCAYLQSHPTGKLSLLVFKTKRAALGT